MLGPSQHRFLGVGVRVTVAVGRCRGLSSVLTFFLQPSSFFPSFFPSLLPKNTAQNTHASPTSMNTNTRRERDKKLGGDSGQPHNSQTPPPSGGPRGNEFHFHLGFGLYNWFIITVIFQHRTLPIAQLHCIFVLFRSLPFLFGSFFFLFFFYFFFSMTDPRDRKRICMCMKWDGHAHAHGHRHGHGIKYHS